MIFSASMDGFLKFWKKSEQGIEFVKSFHSHQGGITELCLNQNETRLVSLSEEDRLLRLYDVPNFDIIQIVKLCFTPGSACFISNQNSYAPVLAIADLTESEF